MKTINFKPINNKIVVELIAVDEKTVGGLIKSPEQIEREKRELKEDTYLTVVAVSDDVKNIKLGAQVLINIEMYRPLVIEGETYGLVEIDFVLGHLE